MSGERAVNLAALRARFWSARGNLFALNELHVELGQLSGPGVLELQREIESSIQVKQAPGPQPVVVQAPASPVQPTDLVGKIRARAKTQGQPLYRYGVTDDEFEALLLQLKNLHRRGALEQANDRSAAAFVLYYAEWFRREYAGGGYSWDAPFSAGLSQPARKALAIDGLRWWGRKPRRAPHGELRLMSLALEGGFPTRLLEARENSRIAQHLARLLSQAEGADDPTEEAVEALSEGMGENLGTYDHTEFHALCAELVLAILALKAEATAQAPEGVPPTAWLDGARPDWRDDLPIGLPGEGARRLLDELVSAPAGRLLGEGARITRLLVRGSGTWVPSAVVRMSGEIDMRRTGFYPPDGRLRVRAAGALAGVLAGELGLIDPPTSDDQHWLCRARGGRDFEVAIALNLDLELELRAGSTVRTVMWPGGAGLRGDVLVFVDPLGDDSASAPQRLVLLGQGSVRTRRQKAYCAVPAGYVVKLAADGQSLEPYAGGPSFTLFCAAAPILITGPTGETYRVDVGADKDHAEQLVAEGTAPRGVEALETGIQVFCGVPTLTVRTGSGLRTRNPSLQDLSWRRVGEQAWRPWPSGAAEAGFVEVAWRDGPSGVMRDRIRFVVLPFDFSISSTPIGHFRTRIELGGATGWALSMAPSDNFKLTASDRRIDLEVTGQPQRRVTVDLQGPSGKAVQLCLRPRFGAAAFFRADGRMFAERVPVMIDDLKGASAFGEGREQLYLRGPAGGFARAEFDDELPLWSITEDVARLLSGGRDLDDHVFIEFGRGGDSRLSVGRYSSTIEQNAAGLIFVKTGAAPARDNAQRRLEWFSIVEPAFHLLADGREFALMPPALTGPGVAVLRDAGRIIGRPTLVQGRPAFLDGSHSGLQHASTITGARPRADAIDAALDRLGEDGAEAQANHAYLLRLAAQLDGLPPSALDPLKHLAGKPAALAALLAGAATEQHLAAVWGLERDLPFLWATAPVSAWIAGFQRQEVYLGRMLEDRGLEAEMAKAIALSSVRSAATNIANLDPALRVVMTFCQLVDTAKGTPPTIFQAAQGRVSRVEINDHDPRIRALTDDPSRASCFRPNGAQGRLPDFSKFLAAHWEGLDAPCACALAAAGQQTLTDQQILAARTARAEEPVSFNDMYAAALTALARGDNLLCAP